LGESRHSFRHRGQRGGKRKSPKSGADLWAQKF
jgi:hypothetical protein